MTDLHSITRIVVFALFCIACLIATAGWVVRTRRISPFSALGRGLRRVSDPFTRPIERVLVRSGNNPITAGWWLVIGTALAGVLVLSLMDWLVQTWYEISGAAAGGVRPVSKLAILLVYDVLFVALVVRVIGSWIAMFRFSRWVRPAYLLTDWLVEPIRRVMPRTGPIDLSPLVAWFVLWLLRQFLLSII